MLDHHDLAQASGRSSVAALDVDASATAAPAPKSTVEPAGERLKPDTYNSHKVYYGISISTIRSYIYADLLPDKASVTAVQAFFWREQS
jgi:hypothetical protein